MQKIKVIQKAMNENVNKRNNQGFSMTYKNRRMYEIGFEDAINWILGN